MAENNEQVAEEGKEMKFRDFVAELQGNKKIVAIFI